MRKGILRDNQHVRLGKVSLVQGSALASFEDLVAPIVTPMLGSSNFDQS